MKKLLVVLLAAVMVFGLATIAFADDLYTDIDEQSTPAKDAIHKISALGVVNGYPDKTFKPEGSITRAEFAKIACVMGGVADADFMKSAASGFKDVAVDIWYTGWINVAYGSGYVIGYPDGTFKPNNTITQAEVLTVLLRIAGYDDNLPGTWPTNYLVKANQLEVTENITLSSSAPATRAQVAIMASNLLGVDVVVYSKDISKFVEVGYDVMLANFKSTFVEGVRFVDNKSVDDVIDNWKVVDGDTQVEIVGVSKPYTLASSCYFANNANLSTIAGQQADLILDKKEKILYLEVTSKALIVAATDAKLDGSNATKTDKIKLNGTSYKNVSGLKAEEVIAAVDGYTKYFLNDDSEIYALTILGGYAGTLDADPAKDKIDKYDAIASPSSTFVLSEYNSSSEKLMVFCKSVIGSPATKEFALKGKDVKVFKDGKVAELEDLEKLDTIFLFKDKCGIDFVVCAETPQEHTISTYYTSTAKPLEIIFSGSSTRYEVVITGTTGTKYSIDENDYDLLSSADTVKDKLKGTAGGQFAWNRLGQLQFVTYGAVTEATTTVNGVVKSISSARDDNLVISGYNNVTIYTFDGSTVTYSFKDGEDYYETVANRFKIGDAIQFKIDANEKITDRGDDFTPDDHTPFTIANNTININGKIYSIGSTVILNINWKTPGDRTSGIDSVDVVNKSKFGSSIKSEYIQYLESGASLKYLVLEDYGSNTDNKYAVIKEVGAEGKYIDFFNADRVEVEKSTMAAWEGLENYLVKYQLVSGKAVLDAVFVPLNLENPGTRVKGLSDATEGKEGAFKWGDDTYRFNSDTDLLVFNSDIELIDLEDTTLSDYNEDGSAYVVFDPVETDLATLIVIIQD